MKDLNELEIRKEDCGYSLILDGRKLRYAEDYKIESSAELGVGVAKLTLEMLVKYPADPKCETSESDTVDKVVSEINEKTRITGESPLVV